MSHITNGDFRQFSKPHSSHTGFSREVPETVAWSQCTYVKPLPAEEQREMCRTSTAIYMVILAVFFLAAIFTFAGVFMEKIFPEIKSSSWGGCVLGILWGMAIVLSFLSPFFIRLMVILKIRSRRSKLFAPREGIVVSIEDAFTYDKRKLVVEDFGLLKITPEYVFLEMTNHRAQFDRGGLSVSLLHTAKNAAGVRLSYNQGSYSWTVVVCPLANTGILSGFTQGATRSKALLKLFTKMGYGSRPQAEIAEPAATHVENRSVPAAAVQPRQTAVAGDGDENADIMEVRYKNILAAVDEKLNQRKKNWWKNAGILLISLLIFFQLGFFQWGLELVLMLILVIFIHEMGHFLGMKLFGYRNVQMFFIPMFGAAVSGTSQNVAVWKKAMVSLMGPLPGIFISMGLFVIALVTNNQDCFNAGAIFLFLNVFNLLPIMPLDGGRFLHEIIFSRNRYLEMVMNILAAVALFGLGVMTESKIFSILAILSLTSIRFRFQLAGTVERFSKDMAAQNEFAPCGALRNVNGQDIPGPVLKKMLEWIHNKLPGPMNPKDIANLVLEIWDRIQVRPARWGAMTLLLLLFFTGYAVSLVSAGVGMFGYYREFGNKSKIVACQEPNSTTGYYKEQIYFSGELRRESQLSADMQLYHGSCKFYFDKQLVVDGQWDMGLRAGRWTFYEDPNTLTQEVFYEAGKPVLKRVLEDGQWKEYRWDDFSEEEKQRFLRRVEKPRGPQDSVREK